MCGGGGGDLVVELKCQRMLSCCSRREGVQTARGGANNNVRLHSRVGRGGRVADPSGIGRRTRAGTSQPATPPPSTPSHPLPPPPTPRHSVLQLRENATVALRLNTKNKRDDNMRVTVYV